MLSIEKTKSAQVENRIEVSFLQWPTVFGTQNEIREKSSAAVRGKYIFCLCNIRCTDDGTFHLTPLNSFVFSAMKKQWWCLPQCVLVRTVYRIFFVPKVQKFLYLKWYKNCYVFQLQFAHTLQQPEVFKSVWFLQSETMVCTCSMPLSSLRTHRQLCCSSNNVPCFQQSSYCLLKK